MTRGEAIKILSDESLSSVCEAIDFAIDAFLNTGRKRAKWIDAREYCSEFFEIARNNGWDKFMDQPHQIVAEAYKKLDEARPSGLFGRHSLSQELIEYITAPTLKEAIYGKKE